MSHLKTPSDCLFSSSPFQTNPPEAPSVGDTLYTWGSNRNLVLGGGDGDERALPDRVNLKRPEKRSYVAEGEETRGEQGDLRSFDPVLVRHVVMGKLHTGAFLFFSSHELSPLT